MYWTEEGNKYNQTMINMTLCCRIKLFKAGGWHLDAFRPHFSDIKCNRTFLSEVYTKTPLDSLLRQTCQANFWVNSLINMTNRIVVVQPPGTRPSRAVRVVAGVVLAEVACSVPQRGAPREDDEQRVRYHGDEKCQECALGNGVGGILEGSLHN